ncbi:hypothetical protein [Kineococcus sp. SYSU DK018]|uniref:hypothetical protein n=1 Tax=Kineococcus sp. SYSU DK018 TaxID=3383139 RepID=UPI003D7CE078
MSKPLVIQVSEDMVRQAILEKNARRRLKLPVPPELERLASVPLPAQQLRTEVIDLRGLEQVANGQSRDDGLSL